MIGAIVLGIVAGYLGRLLMPGKDAMGFIATVLLGIAGAVVGFLVLQTRYHTALVVLITAASGEGATRLRARPPMA